MREQTIPDLPSPRGRPGVEAIGVEVRRSRAFTKGGKKNISMEKIELFEHAKLKITRLTFDLLHTRESRTPVSSVYILHSLLHFSKQLEVELS